MDAKTTINVLLVEDDPDNLVLISEYIYSTGCTVDVAIDGKVALEKLKTDTYQIVVTDIVMPNLDGLSLLKHIQEKYSNVPVIVISGFANEYPPKKILDAGAFEYLPKPFVPNDLISILKRAIQKLNE